MQHKRNDVVKMASSFVGTHRGDDNHLYILKTYNDYKHSAWNVQTPWCAIFFSFVAIKLGYTDFPISASCGEIINQCLARGWWIEQDNYEDIKPGMGIIYDWNDGEDFAEYDNEEGHHHIGWIIEVDPKKRKFLVVEGNMSNASVVGTRVMDFNGRYIRGFVNPPYNERNYKIQYYTVKGGDTLTSIAKAHGLTLEELVKLNPQIKNINLIFIGQKVRIK